MRSIFLSFFILVFCLKFSLGGNISLETLTNQNVFKNDSFVEDRALFYIYNWVSRIANYKYFNQRYFKDSILGHSEGVFILTMHCVKDYSGDYFLKIKKSKYIRKFLDSRYLYIPVSKISSKICTSTKDKYVFRVFENIMDRVSDIENNRECFYTALSFCLQGKRNICRNISKPSYVCIFNK